MKKWLQRLAVVLVLILLGLVLRRTVYAPEPVAVRVAEVAPGLVESTLTNSTAGTVRARRRAGLSTGTAGIVAALEVERGDRVKAGQVLLRLEDTEQRSQLLYAERQLSVAEADHRQACVATERAHREWERNRLLASEAVVSADRLDALRTAYDLAQAQCEVATANVQLAAAGVEVGRAQLQKTELKAPFDAIIAGVPVELGEWVTPSAAWITAPDLIDALDPSSLYISAPMDEVDAQLLEVGQRARVTIDSYPGRSFWGNVVRLAPYVLDVEQQNRTLEIEVELDDQALSATLLPGTSADVEVIVKAQTDVLRIPTYALMEGDRVFLLAADSIAERLVTTGVRNWDWTEILSGLRAGELVVTNLDRPEVLPGAKAFAESANAER